MDIYLNIILPLAPSLLSKHKVEEKKVIIKPLSKTKQYVKKKKKNENKAVILTQCYFEFDFLKILFIPKRMMFLFKES